MRLQNVSVQLKPRSKAKDRQYRYVFSVLELLRVKKRKKPAYFEKKSFDLSNPGDLAT